jgi:signal transduction histidine kinase
MTFKKKLLLAFSIMIVPLAIIGAQAFWNLRAETSALRTLEVSLSRARIFADVETGIYRKLRKVRDYLSGQDREAREEFGRLDRLFHAKLDEWTKATADPEDRRLAAELERLDGEIGRLASRAFDLYESGQQEQAFQLIQQEVNGHWLPALDATIKAIYGGARTRNIQRAFKEVEATQRSTTMVLILIVLSSAMLGVLFSVLIARNLATPIERLKMMMDRVGEGDFAHAREFEIRSRDEIGSLAGTFVRMAERLQRAQDAMAHLNADLQHKIETLKETQAQLIQSEKLASIGKMSAAVAHGLRNPLASVRAATQLSLHLLPRASPVREHLTAVIAEVDRLDERIDHLLDFTKPAPWDPVAQNVGELLERVLSVFRDQLARQDIRLDLDVKDGLPEAWVDPSQVEQALLEVIANAVEAMPTGGSLAVAARIDREVAGGAAVVLSVEDTGEGIQADALPRLGEPFFTTKADGTGLGLAIAKRFVEQNKGRLVVERRDPRGTTVTVALPAREPSVPVEG